MSAPDSAKWQVYKFRTKGVTPVDYWTVGRDTGRTLWLRYELPDGRTTRYAEDCALHKTEREALQQAGRLNAGGVP